MRQVILGPFRQTEDGPVAVGMSLEFECAECGALAFEPSARPADGWQPL